ncbi:unnamed protein product [Orchesella dallaii]|uniref:BZIP domain-containing protein n=1 Tax=Orchesella dallaii TaxID=48710 RepID=A0ABP1QNI1_9HEXA
MSDAIEIDVNITNDFAFNDLLDGTASLETISKLIEIDKSEILGLGLNAHSEIQENSSTQIEEETVSQLTNLEPVPLVQSQSLCADSAYDTPLLGNPIDEEDIAGLDFNETWSCDGIDLPSSLFGEGSNDTFELEAILEPSELTPIEEELGESRDLSEVEEEPTTSTALPQQRKRKSSLPIRDIGNMDLSISTRSNLREDAMRQNAGSNKQNMENVKKADTVISPGTMKAPQSRGRQKKIKMHQLPDVNDPKIKRAKMARENREKKKQAEMELTEKNAKLTEKVQELTKEVDKCRGRISELGHANLHLQKEKETWIAEREELKASLQREIDRNEKLQVDLNKDVATPEQTVEIIDNFRDIVSRLPNKCEIEVKSSLAEMRVPVMSEEKMKEIRRAEDHAEYEPTIRRSLKFKGVFDLKETKANPRRTELMMVPDTDDQNFH